MTSQSWWWDIIRRLFASLDATIYGLVQIFYQLFAYISNLTILDDTAIDDFKIRVYMILGIVMLFKIAFSLISLLMNPDDLMDSKKGVTGIIRRIIISLVLITFIPTIFATTRNIQKIIIDDNILGQFFFGKLEEDKANEVMANSGNVIAFHVLSAFYYPNPKLELVEKEFCVTGENVIMPDIDTVNGTFVGNSRTVSVLEADQEDCGKKEFIGEAEGFYYLTHRSYNIKEYLGEYVNEEVGGDGSASGDGYYAMEYSWFISTIAGVVVAWMFLGYCIDAGVRAVKLAALELIAPVPIFSYIDPKKGESIFQNWVKTTISTYLSLFGRLVLIYFVIYICHLIRSSGIQIIGANGNPSPLQDDTIMARFATAFIYIGLLLFAKSAPQIFSDMFGIKLEESFGTKLAKKGIVGTGLAAALMGTKLVGEGYKKMKAKAALGEFDYKHRGQELTEEQQKEREKIVDSGRFHGIRALTTGATAGFMGGFKSGKFGYSSGMKAANAKHKIREDGITFSKEWSERTSSFFGVSGKYGDFGQYKDELKDLENKRRNAQALENRFNEQRVNEFANMIRNFDGLDETLVSKYEEALEINDVEAIDRITKEMTVRYMERQVGNGLTKEQSVEQYQKLNKTIGNINKLNAEYHRQDERGQKLEKDISDTKKKIDSINGGS